MTVTPMHLTINEGSTGSYTVKLNTQPTATVTISVSASDDVTRCLPNSGASCTRKSGVATVDAESLTFTTTTWNQAQTVTVTANDEDMAGVFKFAKVTHSVSGGNYDGISASEVRITVTDDDVRDIHYQIGTSGNLQTRETLGLYEGSTGTYWVSLRSEPTAETTVALASQDSRVTVNPRSLTFTVSNWDQAMMITVGVADNDVVGEARVQVPIKSTFSGAGTDYAVQQVPPFTVNVFNNDIPPWTVHEGESFIHELRLTQYPGQVTVRAETTNSAIVDIAPDNVLVTEANYQAIQFTVTGVRRGEGKIHLWVGQLLIQSFRVTVIVPRTLTVDAVPACGTTVTDTSVEPVSVLKLTPAPATEVETEYRPITEDNPADDWLGSRSIGTSGRSIPAYHSPLGALRRAYAGFAGFEWRLKDDPDVTARCTWQFDDDDGTTPPPPASPSVRLSASPNPVDEGSSVTVTARLSEALAADVTIPLTLTAGTAEAGDFGSLSSITINSGSTTGTGTITTSEDADTDDETFTVALGSTLPSQVVAGSPSSVEVTIADDDDGGPTTTPATPPSVRLSASPNPVDEGSSVTVTARLSETLTADVTIPLTLTAGTAEEDDFGSLTSITISAGSATGAGTIPTSRDADTDDETFTVALGSTLPSPVVAGSPSSVDVTIRDDGEGGGGGEGGQNHPPMAVADTVRTAEDTEVLIDVMANDTDVEGDAMSIETMTAPLNGTARIAADGQVAYAPEPDWHGTDRFTYTVADGNGGTAEAEVVVVVAPVNDPPVALADTVRTAEDTEVLIDVLANDTDVEGETMTIESVAAPLNGTARIAADGQVTYAPEPDWHGTDLFTYSVEDGNGATAQAEVVVIVAPVNDPPVAVADTVRTAEDTEVLIDVLANDTDVEGDAMSIESVTAPPNGTARIAADGQVAYAPEPDWHGTDRFAYAVADGNGGTARAEVVVVVAPVNDPPVAVGTIPEQSLVEGGVAAMVELMPYFEDPDGDPLTYSAVSSDSMVAVVAVSGSMLTLTPVEYGEASVEVTARDPGGLAARQAIRVGATDLMVRMVLDETLAAMARAHLASARMTLSRRVGSGGAMPGSMLKVLGRTVPLSRTAALEAAGRMLESWAVSRRLHIGALRNPGIPGSGTEWVFAFGDQEESARPGGAWRFWGQGDIQTFAGEPSPVRGYEGDLRTGWAGIDRAFGARWLVGVAVARSTGWGDWRAGTAGGRLETSLTALHPYLHWSDGASSMWAMAGGGRGSAENTRATGREGMSDLGLGLGLFEARRRFGDWLGLRADASWARLATGSGGETVDGRSASVDQQRLGIELSPSPRLGGFALEPFLETIARRDGGAGQTGSGLELSGGLRASDAYIRVYAHGRILLLHSAKGYEERGLGVTVSVGKQGTAEGLSLSVSPRWGGPAAPTGALWREQLALRTPAGYGPGEAWSLDAAARYGQRLPGGRLLKWFSSFNRSRRDWGLTVGLGLGLTDGMGHTRGAFRSL